VLSTLQGARLTGYFMSMNFESAALRAIITAFPVLRGGWAPFPRPLSDAAGARRDRTEFVDVKDLVALVLLPWIDLRSARPIVERRGRNNPYASRDELTPIEGFDKQTIRRLANGDTARPVARLARRDLGA
jgi:hypothetical protein